MPVKIQQVSPQARCYICGKTEIAVVCHHCGRPMCGSHGPVPLPDKRGVSAREYTDLGIRDLQIDELAAHCEYCLHYTRDPFAWLVGTVWGVISILTSIGMVVYGISEPDYRQIILAAPVLLILGLLIIFAHRVITPRSLRNQMLNQRPPFPLMGSFKARLRESLTGTIMLTPSGEYNILTYAPTGSSEYTLVMSPRNRESLELYLDKFELDESRQGELSAHGGTILIEGRASMQYNSAGMNLSQASQQVIMLRDTVGHFPFLTNPDSRSREWHVAHTYDVFSDTIPSSGSKALPFTIVPMLIMEGAHRALAFDINLHDNSSSFPQLREIVRINELILYVPEVLGQMRNANPAARASISAEDNGLQQILWRDLPISENDRRQRRKSIYLSFEDDVDPEIVLHGRIQVEYKGTLSGAKGMKYFNPLGSQVPLQEESTTSWITVEFQLDLTSLRFQEDVFLQDIFTHEDTVPTYQLITELTGRLSEQGFYFKQVIENPESTSTNRAYTVNRYWDLEGRFYQGVYPIDFHLILRGEASLRPQNDGFRGDTNTELSVKGTVTSPEMRAQVESIFEQLRHNTEEILQDIGEKQGDLEGIYPVTSSAPATAIELAPSPPAVRKPDMMIDGSAVQVISHTVRTALEEFFRGLVVISVPPDREQQEANNQLPEPVSNTKESIERRLAHLMDALMSGYISEDMYNRLRAELEGDLRNLDEDVGE